MVLRLILINFLITSFVVGVTNFMFSDYFFNRKLLLYPNGVVEGKGTNISLFLALDVTTLSSNTKIVVDCTLRAKDQISGKHVERKCKPYIGYLLSSMDTDTDTRYDTDTYTPTPLIIWGNHIIQCNYMCLCCVRVRHETCVWYHDTPNARSVRAS